MANSTQHQKRKLMQSLKNNLAIFSKIENAHSLEKIVLIHITDKGLALKIHKELCSNVHRAI